MRPIHSPKPATVTPRNIPPLPPIRLGPSAGGRSDRRFGTLLVWYMRALSLLWMAQGVLGWTLVLMGRNVSGGAPLADLPDLGAVVVVMFAVVGLVAAVGLWLAVAWGGVVWLVVVAAQWMTTLALPGFLPLDWPVALADLLLVGGYFYLTYRAAHETER